MVEGKRYEDEQFYQKQIQSSKYHPWCTYSLIKPTIKPKPDIFDFLVSFGEKCEQGIKIDIGFNIQGEEHKKKFEEAKKLSPSVEEDSLGLVFKIPAENPAFVKTAIDEIVNEIITMPDFPIPIENLEDNPFFYYCS